MEWHYHNPSNFSRGDTIHIKTEGKKLEPLVQENPKKRKNDATHKRIAALKLLLECLEVEE